MLCYIGVPKGALRKTSFPCALPGASRERLIAIYHLSSKPLKRADGRSAVAAAAYRAGERIWDARQERWCDYSRRRADIDAWIAAPEGAPGWSRAELWNGVEAREKRKNSRTAHELEVALPVELDRAAQRELVEGYVAEYVTARGLIADVAIHRDRDQNPHAHILMTTRQVGPDGFGEKDFDLDRLPTLHAWRGGWASHTNERLREAGSPERVDHRSLREQGVERQPTTHDGPAIREMEARGVRTTARIVRAHHRGELVQGRDPSRSRTGGRGRAGGDRGRRYEPCRDHEPERDI